MIFIKFTKGSTYKNAVKHKKNIHDIKYMSNYKSTQMAYILTCSVLATTNCMT